MTTQLSLRIFLVLSLFVTFARCELPVDSDVRGPFPSNSPATSPSVRARFSQVAQQEKENSSRRVPLGSPGAHTTESIDNERKRQAIRDELARNHDAIQCLYELIDSLPLDGITQQLDLEDRIHEYDLRNDRLFEELDQIDRHEFTQQRVVDLRAVAVKLAKESRLLHKQSTLIVKAIEDGSLAKLADQEWSSRSTAIDDSADVPIQLFVENVKLRAELQALKEDLQRTRNTTPSKSADQ